MLTTLDVFLNGRYGYDVRCEVVGEHGTLALTEPTVMVVDSSRTRGYDYPADWRPRFAEAYRVQLQEWVDSIAAGAASPLASAHDGLIATVVAQAMITSMHDDGAGWPSSPTGRADLRVTKPVISGAKVTLGTAGHPRAGPSHQVETGVALGTSAQAAPR